MNICVVLLLHHLYLAGLRFVDGNETWTRARGGVDAQSPATNSATAGDEEKEEKIVVLVILLLHHLYHAGLRFVDGRKT